MKPELSFVAGMLFMAFLVSSSSCTMLPNKGKPGQDYPDASTPPGMNEYNGGILADIAVNGHGYNVVTPNLAAKVQKWQGNQNGFIQTVYEGQAVTAIDKGVMFQYDFHDSTPTTNQATASKAK